MDALENSRKGKRRPPAPELPQVYFGPPDDGDEDWRKADAETPDADLDDDDEITEAPPWLIAVLGYDPLNE